MRPEAVDAMQPFLALHPGNPSGAHAASRRTKTAIEQARTDLADFLGCDVHEIVFTGGGSESDNLAVKGAAWAARAADADLDGVVTSAIEHKAVLGAAERLGHDGFRVATIAADAAGTIDLDALADALDSRTAVVSVMLVNNETGVRQPLDEIAALVRDRAPKAVLHTDAVQAPQWLDLAVATQACDLVSISGHKFGGPKGVGALVRRRDVPLVPLIEGGGHERGMRAGTHDVAGIVALATAATITARNRDDEGARIEALRDRFEARLERSTGALVRNGDATLRVPGLSNLAFHGVESEALLVALDMAGVCAASGSACSSGALDPSHVLLAMGCSVDRAQSSLRCSFGWASLDSDADAADIVASCVEQLRGGAS